MIEHPRALLIPSVKSPQHFISFSKPMIPSEMPDLCTAAVSVPYSSLHHVRDWETALPLSWRTSTFAFVTLPRNCLFTHLFPQGDSGLSEVGNFVLFHFAVSCWLRRRPEQKGGPPFASMWPSHLHIWTFLVLSVLSTSNSCYE